MRHTATAETVWQHVVDGVRILPFPGSCSLEYFTFQGHPARILSTCVAVPRFGFYSTIPDSQQLPAWQLCCSLLQQQLQPSRVQNKTRICAANYDSVTQPKLVFHLAPVQNIKLNPDVAAKVEEVTSLLEVGPLEAAAVGKPYKEQKINPDKKAPGGWGPASVLAMSGSLWLHTSFKLAAAPSRQAAKPLHVLVLNYYLCTVWTAVSYTADCESPCAAAVLPSYPACDGVMHGVLLLAGVHRLYPPGRGMR